MNSEVSTVFATAFLRAILTRGSGVRAMCAALEQFFRCRWLGASHVRSFRTVFSCRWLKVKEFLFHEGLGSFAELELLDKVRANSALNKPDAKCFESKL